MFLDEPVLFIFHLNRHIVLFGAAFWFLGLSLHFKLFNNFRCLRFLLLNLRNYLMLVALLAEIGEFAHGFVQHRQQLISLQVQVVLKSID